MNTASLSRSALTFLATLSCASICFAEAANTAVDPTSLEQTKFKLMAALLRNTETKLPKKKHCDFSIGKEKKEISIGQWVAWNLSFFAKDQSNWVHAACEPAKSSKLSCVLNFNADSKGESPWSCGFQFRIDPEFKEIERGSLECTGTC